MVIRGDVHHDDSLGAAIAAWEASLNQAGHAVNTIKAFTADARLLARYVGAGRPVGGIGTRDLMDFLRWMESERDVPCSPKTYSRRVTSIKALFRFLGETGACEADPAAMVVQKTVQSPMPDILTAEEAQRALVAARAWMECKGSSVESTKSRSRAAGDARPFTLLALLLLSGIKKGECAALGLTHVDLHAEDQPVLFVRYSNPRQRFKERRLVLTAEWADAYRRYLAEYAPVEKVFPWSPRRLEYILSDIGQKAKLTKHLSFDMCRWTCAVMDRRRGMESDAVRQKLGLSRIQWREVGVKLELLVSAQE